MSPTTHPHTGTPAPPPTASVFDRILVGVDGSKQGFDACRQAARLAERDSAREAATVLQLTPLAATALRAGLLEDELEQAAGACLAIAGHALGPHAEVRKLYGLVVPQLLEEARRLDATLLAIGSHDHPRLEEILLGGAAGELLHQAPCTVLLARPVPNVATFPTDIVVGVDGSEEAERACEVAAGLAARFHSTLHRVVALGGKAVDFDLVQERHPEVEGAAAAPVPALVEAAACADLLVVGSRGLHGFRALGSVSERVAHRAGCSVLVVRRPPVATRSHD